MNFKKLFVPTFCEVSGSIRTEKLREPLENILVFDEPENRQSDDYTGDENGGDVDVVDNVLTLDHADHHLDMRPETLEQDLLLQVILIKIIASQEKKSYCTWFILLRVKVILEM